MTWPKTCLSTAFQKFTMILRRIRSCIFVPSFLFLTSSYCIPMSVPLNNKAAAAAKLVADFASRPYIQKALQQERKDPYSVLSFFFGIDFENETMVQQDLVEGGCLTKMSPLWFNGGMDYDKLCEPFRETVRAVGRRETRATWPHTTDSLVAQMICCDQLSRNIFRGSSEAFDYDETALELSRELTSEFLSNAAAPKIPGTLHPPYCAFVVLSLMHSESMQDHDSCLQVLDAALAKWPNQTAYFEWTKQFELDHRAVIERFGRYPHRNKAKGRETLQDELLWLEDDLNLPIWAKSQG
ncbi:hypothetical protein MPSEU_000033100 [Mayamaea pseudoterrestris]|nr:hypothetical protein MPSEU_000033100 [Mayamaea pseudoterrestris]